MSRFSCKPAEDYAPVSLFDNVRSPAATVLPDRPGETSLWHRHSENTFYVCVEHAAAALNRPSDKVSSASRLSSRWRSRALARATTVSQEEIRTSTFWVEQIVVTNSLLNTFCRCFITIIQSAPARKSKRGSPLELCDSTCFLRRFEFLLPDIDIYVHGGVNNSDHCAIVALT